MEARQVTRLHSNQDLSQEFNRLLLNTGSEREFGVKADTDAVAQCPVDVRTYFGQHNNLNCLRFGSDRKEMLADLLNFGFDGALQIHARKVSEGIYRNIQAERAANYRDELNRPGPTGSGDDR